MLILMKVVSLMLVPYFCHQYHHSVYCHMHMWVCVSLYARFIVHTYKLQLLIYMFYYCFREPSNIQNRSHTASQSRDTNAMAMMRSKHYRLRREEQARYNEEKLVIQQQAVMIEENKLRLMAELMKCEEESFSSFKMLKLL